jgi:FKBP-type peptidyl-prolyl cis-trans isomerase 2
LNVISWFQSLLSGQLVRRYTEVGAAGVMGNPLFLAFEKAVIGMVVGDQALVSASGGEYDPNLLFKVPMGHPEVQRLQEELDQPGKGGLHPGATVALSNGNAAVIREVNEEAEVVILDANHPFAGSDLQFAVKLVKIEDKPEDDDDVVEA